MRVHKYSELTLALLSSYHWWLELHTNHVEQASVSASFLIHLSLTIKRFTFLSVRFGRKFLNSKKVFTGHFPND